MMKKPKNNKIARIVLTLQLSLIVLGFTSIIPASVHAQVFQDNKYPLLEPLPCIPNSGQNCTKGEVIKEVNVEQYVRYVFNFSIAAAVLLSVIMIFVGGFQYVASEIPGAKSDAKSRIQGAIGGLIMVLVSYLILYTLDPRLTNIKLGFPKIESTRYKVSFSFLDSLSALGETSALTAAKRYEADTKKGEEKSLRDKASEILQQANNESDPDKKKVLMAEYEKLIGEAKKAATQSTILNFESKAAERLGKIQSLIENNASASDINIEISYLQVEYIKSRSSLSRQGLEDDSTLGKKYKFYTTAAGDAVLAKSALDALAADSKSFSFSSLYSVATGGAEIASWLAAKGASSLKELVGGATNAETARKIALQLKYDETATMNMLPEDSQIIKNQRNQNADKILAASPKQFRNEEEYIQKIKDANYIYANQGKK